MQTAPRDPLSEPTGQSRSLDRGSIAFFLRHGPACLSLVGLGVILAPWLWAALILPTYPTRGAELKPSQVASQVLVEVILMCVGSASAAIGGFLLLSAA